MNNFDSKPTESPASARLPFPLPAGEGQGEGERLEKTSSVPDSPRPGKNKTTAAHRRIKHLFVPRKRTKSRLDPFEKQLVAMEARNVSLHEMKSWLETQKLSCSVSNIRNFLTLRRIERKSAFLFGIQSGHELCQEVEETFAKYPAPQFETLIKIFRVLIMQLATEGAGDPASLKLADQLTRTALCFIVGEDKTESARRKLVMEEARHAEWVKCEQTRALQLCLEEAKKFPDVAEAFRTAFAALKATRTPALRHEDAPAITSGKDNQ